MVASGSNNFLTHRQTFLCKLDFYTIILSCLSTPHSGSLPKLAHAINICFLALKIENLLKIFDIFLIFAQNIDCGYTLEPPRRGGSNEYLQSMF